MPLFPIHRVVTGHDADGKAVVALDGPLPSIVELQAVSGMIFHEAWETPNTPAPVNNGADPTLGPMMHGPPKNGTRIRFVDLPPDTSYLAEADALRLYAQPHGDLLRPLLDEEALARANPDAGYGSGFA